MTPPRPSPEGRERAESPSPALPGGEGAGRMTATRPAPEGSELQLVNLGCRTNAAEVDEIAALLKDASNATVINSCTVTLAADRDTRKAVRRARRERPEAALVLMGCYVD